jgi:hypothetical protein
VRCANARNVIRIAHHGASNQYLNEIYYRFSRRFWQRELLTG